MKNRIDWPVLFGFAVGAAVLYVAYERRKELEAAASGAGTAGARSVLDFVKANPDDSVRTGLLAYRLGLRSRDFIGSLIK
jgi:hypothetical protein